MIEKIVLKDYMSHEDTEVRFDGSTISVSGDNGCGKSALLEAIPYAYFGLGRDTKEGLSRINGDGSHRVEVHESSGAVIARGRKPSGTGFCEVRKSGELVARGKEADEWISDHLGMDSDTFMLTAFFGLGDSYTDKLLGVTPSTRLETLQSLAKVGPYRKFHSRAKDALSEAKAVYERESARADGARSGIEGSEDLKDSIKRYTHQIEEAKKTLHMLKDNRGDLQSQEEVYQAFVKERERVSVERRSIKETVERFLREREEIESSLEIAKGDLEDSKVRHRELMDAVKGSEDASDIEKRIEEIRDSVSSVLTAIELREVAVNLPEGEEVCPLCEQPVAPDIVDRWREGLERLRNEHGDLENQLSSSRAAKREIDSRISELEEVVRDMVAYSATVEETGPKLSENRKAIECAESDLRKVDDRYVFLTEKLGDEYDGLQSKIREVGEKIDECQGVIHSASGSLDQLRQSLKRVSESKKVISEAEEAMKAAKMRGRSASILVEAWSRYGIPLQLVNQLVRKIEDRATSVYQEFDNGRIEVREVEDRGKPGMQFYLVDRRGDRTYSQLSMGEKIMFFIAIRVAIAYVVAEGSSISVDFLVLDEAMGNLSPRRRDDMVRLVNKALRKMFPQVILVTHTTIADIFDRSIEVSMANDVSVVRVA